MTYQTILAVLRGENDMDRVVKRAVSLAARHESHLIGLHAEPSVNISFAAPLEIPDTTVFDMEQAKTIDRVTSIREGFVSRCEAEGISYEWRPIKSMSGDSAVSAVSSARCSDLIVAQQEGPGNDDDYDDLEALVFDSGRPVMFVPYIAKEAKPIKRALIAWNDTRESARAAFDAMPLLMAAENVEILTVDAQNNAEQSAPTAGAEIATALTRHGVNVTLNSQSSAGIPVAAVIENRVSDMQADLLVMGAFSHSRLREFLFGGVTDTVLKSMPCLTLMSR
ncbi:MAG: universal stress protein [Alphaproteobacteria bacterium]|nr:universal stress protein [Alphaproteobacteria bacterium]